MPCTFHIKECYDHWKMKTNAMRKFSELVPKICIFDVDGDINWARWKEFKAEYHINDSSMHCLVKEHRAMLKLKRKERSKKTNKEAMELQRYIDFLQRKRRPTFGGVVQFSLVTTDLMATSSSSWDDITSVMDVREDRMGCPFGIIDFRCIPSFVQQKIKGMSFYEPFMSKFMAFNLPMMLEPHVWLWIIDKRWWLPSLISMIHKSSTFTTSFIAHICRGKRRAWWCSMRLEGANRLE